jgi:hypothetical protein
LCERTGWPDNQSCQNIVAWLWRKDNERYLIVVNLSDAGAQAEVKIGWDDIAGKTWRLADLMSGAEFERSGDEMASGLYVDLGPWSYHFLRWARA